MASAGNLGGLDVRTQEEIDKFNSIMEMQANLEAYVEILEQPRARGLRFRYECEGRAAGSIPGENSTPENRTYPKIQIHNSNASDAIVVVSCVTKDHNPRPHPHSLVGKDCKKGVCTVKLRKQAIATFPNLGIQCAKKKAVAQALEDRKQLRVDPYQTGFEFEPTSFDLSVVRLCFQVFLPDKAGKFTRIVRPEVSQCIFDRKTVTDLVICRISRHAGSAQGGEDVFLLCDKVNKDDIEVRFFEENEEGVMWEARGDFGQPDVHRQYAIVFRTPPYRDQNIDRPKTVSLQLRRPSDGEKSEPLQFTYAPIDRDPYGLQRKRTKTLHIPEYVAAEEDMQAAGGSNMKTKETIKNRLLAKPNRRGRGPQATVVKQETSSPDAPPCMVGTQQAAFQPNHVFNPNVMSTINFDAGLDPGQMMNLTMQQPKPELGGANQAFEWHQMGVQEMIAEGQPAQQGVATVENGEPTAQNLLSELSEGGNTSLTIDSGSLLQYLQEDTGNPDNLLLNQFLQSADTDMQS